MPKETVNNNKRTRCNPLRASEVSRIEEREASQDMREALRAVSASIYVQSAEVSQ